MSTVDERQALVAGTLRIAADKAWRDGEREFAESLHAAARVIEQGFRGVSCPACGLPRDRPC